MIWVIIIAAIIVIIMGIVDFSCSGWSITKQSFTDSIWGILAIIFGILAILFFYGSNKSYADVKINESFMPNAGSQSKKKRKKKQKGNSFMSNLTNMFTGNKGTGSDIVEYDLSGLTMSTLAGKMAYEMHKPGPVFFKGWGNRRLMLDVERVLIIKQYIEAIRATGNSLLELHADAVLSYEKLEKLIEIKRNELLKKLRESELQLDLLQKQHHAQVEKMRINLEQLQALVYEKIAEIENLNARTGQILSDIDNKKKEVDAEIKIKLNTAESDIFVKVEEAKARITLNQDKAEAEIFVMKLKAIDNSRLSQQRSKILDKIIDEMNLNNIKPVEVYLLIKLLETSGTEDFFDFESRIRMVDEQLNKMKIENEKAKAEAREASAKANETEAQSKQNIKDLYNNK